MRVAKPEDAVTAKKGRLGVRCAQLSAAGAEDSSSESSKGLGAPAIIAALAESTAVESDPHESKGLGGALAGGAALAPPPHGLASPPPLVSKGLADAATRAPAGVGGAAEGAGALSLPKGLDGLTSAFCAPPSSPNGLLGPLAALAATGGRVVAGRGTAGRGTAGMGTASGVGGRAVAEVYNSLADGGSRIGPSPGSSGPVPLCSLAAIIESR